MFRAASTRGSLHKFRAKRRQFRIYAESLGNKHIEPTNDNAAAMSGRVVRSQRLGGVLNYCQREAA